MNESPIICQKNLTYEDDDKPISLKSFQLKEIPNRREESGYSSHDHCHLYEELNRVKAKPAQGSSRALFALVIIVCLISLLALLLTLLMLAGKIGISKEGQCTALLILDKTKCIITGQQSHYSISHWYFDLNPGALQDALWLSQFNRNLDTLRAFTRASYHTGLSNSTLRVRVLNTENTNKRIRTLLREELRLHICFPRLR